MFDPYRGDRVACAPESSLQDLDDALSAAVAVKRHGAQYEPTVLVDVEPSMRVVCEEVFGPVVTVQRYRDLPALFGLMGGQNRARPGRISRSSASA